MRRFRIIADGVSIGLNGENGIFLTDPTGLGLMNEAEFTHINDGFYIRADAHQSRGQVCGTVNFMRSAYSSFKAFADAVVCAEKLVLVYNPDGTEYFADCKLSSIEKDEANGLVMACPIALDLLSLWYTEQTLTGTGSVSVTAGGQADTSVLVTCPTALTNPVLTITDSASVEVARCAITGSSSSFEYSNRQDDSHVMVDGADGISMVTALDHLYGRTRKAFTVALTGAASPALTVVVRKHWRTV